MVVSRFSIAALLMGLVFLPGCDPGKPVTSAAGKPSQATAPPLTTTQVASQKSPGAGANASTASTAPATQSAPSPAQPPANTARDQQLIEAVEQAYQAGVQNYRENHLEAARSNFDYAVDQMLTSGLDLKNDPQLSVEFNRVVDAINTLELEALKQGNGFTPVTEPAPVDVANDVTFPVDPSLKAQAQAELKTTQSDLPLVLNDYVASYINFFANTRVGHATIVNSLTRAGRYQEMIQRILAQEGVPQDLIYQAVAESGFQVRVMNGRGSGAGGMWQFMPGDLHAPPRSAWYDMRFDPEQSTRYYAQYMKYLYNQLGDWYLAMAAYDWGAGNVQRAVQRTGYADFWELYRRNVLPAETKNYVPIILAAAIMAKNPKQYGLDTVKPDPPLTTDSVTTNYSVDLKLVADVVDAPVQEIIGLNPGLLRMATPPDDSYQLQLPPGTKALYQERIAEIPLDRRNSWRFHTIQPGETLAEIGREYHVTPTEIAFVNQLSNSEDLSGTKTLVIPAAPAASASRSTRYIVKRGDTIVTVADRFNVSVEELKRWNRLKGSALVPGHALYVSEPARIGSSRSRSRAPATQRASAHTHATGSKKSASLHASMKQAAPHSTHSTSAKKHIASTQ